jgi:hypothetical protein
MNNLPSFGRTWSLLRPCHPPAINANAMDEDALMGG